MFTESESFGPGLHQKAGQGDMEDMSHLQLVVMDQVWPPTGQILIGGWADTAIPDLITLKVGPDEYEYDLRRCTSGSEASVFVLRPDGCEPDGRLSGSTAEC